MSLQALSLRNFPLEGMEALNVIFFILKAFSASLLVPAVFGHPSLVSLENFTLPIICLNGRVPKACRVRSVWFAVLFQDIFFSAFFGMPSVFFWCVFFFPARKDINLSFTLELCSPHLRFSACSYTWLFVVAAGELNFRDVPDSADRSKFRSIHLRAEQKVYRRHFCSLAIQNS